VSAQTVDRAERRFVTGLSVPRALLIKVLAGGVLFALAILPRLTGITLFITPDEDNWIRRAGNFAQALERGQLTRTYQSGHPGVTTMWVVTIALGPEASALGGITTPDFPVTRAPGFMDLLVRARVAFVALNSALLVLIAALVWRLLGPGPATLAGGLMAFDPFLVAHSQVVHLDALSTGFITVAVLSGGVFWWGGGSRWYLALCAAATGLAVLTKAPSIFLGAFIPLVAVLAKLRHRPALSWRLVLASLLAWGIGALVTVFVLWPALWVAPIGTVQRGIAYTLETAGTPHGPGNFFRGRPTPDPGYLFYPVAVAYRLTPLVLLGLGMLVIFLPPVRLRWQAMLVVDFVLGFLIFLVIASKKLDRYALPVFPSLAILAGLGFWVFWLRIRPRAGHSAFAGAAAVVLVGQAVALYSVNPYPLAFYNPLVGGGPAAHRTMLVGWGEGLDQVAAYLNAQPDAATSTIGVYYPLALNFQGMVLGTVRQFGSPDPVDYVVDYVNAAQRRQTPVEVAGLTPELTVQINGIIYAQVYRLSPPRPIR
jgi:4-amino-4-deoxy-L-arabinose transferase-like glycosyltransferase